MKNLKQILILGMIPVLLAAAGCGRRGNFAAVDSGDTGVYSGTKETSSVELKTVDYAKAVELSGAVDLYVTEIAQRGLTEQELLEFKSLAADLKSYDFTTGPTAEYIGMISSLSDCLLGFYYFNSSDAMLTERIKNLKAAHQKLEKLDQTSIQLPEEGSIKSAALKFKAFGEGRK